MRDKFVLIFSLIIINSGFVISQESYYPEQSDPLTEPWRWKRYRELDGKGINSMLQTKDGVYWFATSKGLFNFNGLEWSNPEIPKRGPSCFIRNLCLAKDSLSFYFGTDSGLYYVVNNKIIPVFVNRENKAIDRLFKINRIIVLHDNSIIAIVGINQYNSLLKIKGNNKTLFATDETIDVLVRNKLTGISFKCIGDPLKSGDRLTIESLFQDNSQNIWMSLIPKRGTKKIARFRFHQFFADSITHVKVFEESPRLRLGKLNEFAQTKDNKIWIVNSDTEIGIYVITGDRWEQIPTGTSDELDNLHTSILNSKDGTVWVGGFGVLYAFKNKRWLKYMPPLENIPNSRITVYEDRKGFLWIYGDKKEIYQVDYSNYSWVTYKGLNYQAKSNDGQEWYISVDNKVVVKNKNIWLSYTTANGLPDAIVKLIITRSNVPWVAGSDKETACAAYFDKGKWTKIYFPTLSWGIDPRAVFEDSKGNLWLGCAVNIREKSGQVAGIVRLENPGNNNQKITHFYVKHGIKTSNCYGIGETKNGNIWMCGSTLHVFNGKIWQVVATPIENTTYQEIISNIKGGEMWIGSRYYGIMRTDGLNWTNYTTDHGLQSNTIISILPLNDKNVWVATENDICRFDGRVWTTNIFPIPMTLSREGGELIAGNGMLWINHSPREWKRRVLNNFVVPKNISEKFQTMGYKADTSPPETKITFYLKEVSYYGNTVINWEGRDLSISTLNDRISFSYRINKGEWSPYVEKTYESFTGLQSGNYTIEVRARDLDFNIDPTPAIVHFRVLAPVWKQPWFIALIIIFVTIIIIYEIREKKRKFSLLKLNKTLFETKENLEKKQYEIIQQNQILEQQKIHIIEQNNREKEAQQAKLRFFTNISHEFRTPLTIINGIILKLTNSRDHKDKDNLNTLQRNSNQLLKLINQLMDFRKLETGALKLKVRKGDISWYIKEVCDTFNNLAGLNKIRLEFSSPGKFEVYFDADFIEKIINNLLSNALKYTPKGGVVKITIHKEDKNREDHFSITVEDSGIGISTENMKKIFEPFYQVSRENLNQVEGTGIGLSLVKYLVKAHHGDIDVKSVSPHDNIGSGFTTCFTIILPKNSDVYGNNEIAEESETPGPEPVIDAIPEMDTFSEWDNNTNHLVMVVEDNNDLRNMILSSLKDSFSCCEADNGLSAFEIAVDKMPDLIVSDIMMPKMNGIELCRRLKSDIRTSHIPVILLTARTADEHKLEGYLTGADDYVTKPFNMSLLITRIRNLIEIRTLLRKQFSREFRLEASDQIINSVDADFLKKVMDVIEKNIANPDFGVEALSNEVNIGTRNLLRKIMSLTNYKPVELIRIVRLKRAEQLLVLKQLTVAEIAYDVGFTDPSYFTKCFVNYFGMPPREYMEKKAEEL